MSSRDEALVTASVMRWAREQASFSPEEAAAKIRRPVEDILAWEDGSLRPSIAQARRAAEVYRRPLAVFYLPEPPEGFATLRDFRILPETEDRRYRPELALLIRTAHYRQQWMREYLADEGAEPLRFVGSASMNDTPRGVALSILVTLQLSPEEQSQCRTRQQALRLWMDRAEAAGIFVFRQGQIAPAEARGFLLSDDLAPFIFLNSDDAKAAQLFTLAHELAHLWLNQSGVSNLEPRGRAPDALSAQIEAFCNRVAAEALLEERAFDREWASQDAALPLEDRVKQLSDAFKVSEEAVARRLRDRGIISNERYLELRRMYQDRWRDQKARERERIRETEGGPSYYVTTVSKNGHAFTQTVIGAFVGGAISGRDASSLLNVKVNNLRRLGETAGVWPSRPEARRG